MTFSATTTFDPPPGEVELSTRRRFEEWLPTLVADNKSHARFVHTLSMLEHIGSAKIARTQSGVNITTDVLEHLAEETRHAHYLKQLAKKINGNVSEQFADSWLMAGPSARVYFSKLDVSARRFARAYLPVESRDAGAYLLVSWLVERRAMWLYPAYHEVLQTLGRGFSVRTIINDEAGHLAEMVEGLKRFDLTEHPALPTLILQEEELFRRLIEAMIGEGARTPAAERCDA